MDSPRFDLSDLPRLMEHADNTSEILSAVSSLPQKIDSMQEASERTERRRFLITTVIAVLSFIAGAIAAAASIFALLP